MKTFETLLAEHQAVVAQLPSCSTAIEAAADTLIEVFRQGGKVLLCGNGGSAADCQHIAAEFVVRYEKKRGALAAIALTTDSSILTAHANDYDFDTVFARQVEAIGRHGDCLIAISTSGYSKNVLAAAEVARAKGMAVIVLTGGTGGGLVHYATHSIVVPSTVTARIQEAHILIGHWWCGVVEEVFSVSNHA